MPGRRWDRRKPAAAALCIVVFGALALAGCSSSGTQYVKSSEDHTYFKLPSGWKQFDEQSLIQDNEKLSNEQKDQILNTSWRLGFDASPEPHVDHVFATNSAFPVGFAEVDQLSASDRDAVSDETLRNQFIPVDQLSQNNQLDVLSYESVNRSGGFHGIRFRARVHSAPDSPIYAQGPAFTIEQISFVNQAHDKSYSLITMCSSKCFEKNTSRIEGVLDSWTVEES